MAGEIGVCGTECRKVAWEVDGGGRVREQVGRRGGMEGVGKVRGSGRRKERE